MTRQTNDVRWCLDEVGRTISLGDRVKWWRDSSRESYRYGTVVEFTGTPDEWAHGNPTGCAGVYVQPDDLDPSLWELHFGHEVWLAYPSMITTDVVRAAEAHLTADRFHPGDVVGVLDLGPAELQGRTGEVTMTAWTDQPLSGMGERPADVVYVVADLAHEGWVSPEHLALIEPAPVPGAVSQSAERLGW
jgi:hypothetical protein